MRDFFSQERSHQVSPEKGDGNRVRLIRFCRVAAFEFSRGFQTTGRARISAASLTRREARCRFSGVETPG